MSRIGLPFNSLGDVLGLMSYQCGCEHRQILVSLQSTKALPACWQRRGHVHRGTAAAWVYGLPRASDDFLLQKRLTGSISARPYAGVIKPAFLAVETNSIPIRLNVDGASSPNNRVSNLPGVQIRTPRLTAHLCQPRGSHATRPRQRPPGNLDPETPQFSFGEFWMTLHASQHHLGPGL